MEKFDVAVIGAGPGGYPAAIRAAQLGARTVIIEREALGGTCLNWGCIPTKSLIACSDLHHRMTRASDWGIIAGGKVKYDYAAMVARKDAVVAKLQGGVGSLLKANGVTVLSGEASFVSRNRIAVSGSVIEAGSVVIATGSESAVPSFLPKDECVLESRAFLALTRLPESLCILGGGVIGCEFACMAAQLGVKVTVVEMLEDILMIVDRDVRRELRKRMEEELGIRVMTGAALESVTAGKSGIKGSVGGTVVNAAMLLVAVGRRPVTQGLELEKAGLATNPGGYIEVDEHCRSRISGIFAVGDVTGMVQLAHAATMQGITAAGNATGRDRRKMEKIIPSCIFTAPEIGSAGLTEQEASAKGLKVKVGKFGFGGLGKAMASGETGGFVKWVVNADTDQLVGAHAVGAHATELIAEGAAAVRAELTAREIGNTVHSHPTLSEAWMEAAHAVHGECIHAVPARR